jgi:tetratricopeptide (TPR) repeat protein
MLKKRRSAAKAPGGTTTHDGASAASSPTRRRHGVLWLALLVLASLTVTLVVIRWPKPRPQTAIAKAAENATPEIAELLREINDVACDLIEQYPDNPAALDVMARLHYRFNESEEALRYWNEAIELDPNFCPAYQSIGVLYLELGEHAKSAQFFRKALELEPGSPAFAVELAQALIANGQPEEGIAILQKDLVLHPKAMASLAMLGHAYVQTRQFAEAKKYFEQVIAIAPDYTNAYHGLTTACANLGETELAKEYAAKLKTYKDRDDATHRQMLKSHDDVKNVRSRMSEIYMAAGNVHLAQDNPQAAEAYLLKAIELAPNSTPAREVLTWLYQIQGRKEDEIRTLQALLKVAPDRVSAQMGCAALCAEIGWIDDAVAAYRKAIKLTPQQAGGYLALARLYIEHVRNLPEAKTLAQKAVELEPTGRHYYWLAAACQINGDKPGAQAAIQRAADLEPGNAEYQRVLRSIDPRN